MVNIKWGIGTAVIGLATMIQGAFMFLSSKIGMVHGLSPTGIGSTYGMTNVVTGMFVSTLGVILIWTSKEK